MQFLCTSAGVFHCTHSNGICHTGLLTACEQDQDGTVLRGFHSKNKFEKLMHLVLFYYKNHEIYQAGKSVSRRRFYVGVPMGETEVTQSLATKDVRHCKCFVHTQYELLNYIQMR